MSDHLQTTLRAILIACRNYLAAIGAYVVLFALMSTFREHFLPFWIGTWEIEEVLRAGIAPAAFLAILRSCRATRQMLLSRPLNIEGKI